MSRNKKISFLILTIILITLPVILIAVKQNQDTRSSAAAADKLEAEDGVLSANGASKQNDSEASDGEYVLFGSSNIIITDTFNRSINNSWGSAEMGGAYSLFSSTADYSVNNEAVMRIPSAGSTRRVTLESINKSEIETSLKVKTDKLASGTTGSSFYLIGRKIANGDYYAVKFRFNSNQTIAIDGVKNISTQETSVGGNITISGITHQANTYYNVKTRITGVSPTLIQAKIWQEGSIEPTAWQYSSSDSTATNLQTSGATGISSTISSNATNSPFTFSFDDYSVKDLNSTNTPNPSQSLTPTPITIDSGLTVPTSSFQFPTSPASGGQSRIVTAYGSTCNDNSNDDTVGIKAAIAAASTGDDVIFPANCILHLKTWPIDLKTGVNIKGQDKTTSILSGMFTTAANPIFYARTQASTSTNQPVSNLSITNFSYKTESGTAPEIVIKLGNGTWNTNNSEWKTVSKIRIENLTLENYRRFGIAIENSEFIYVHNNTMKNATSLGVGGEGYGLQISMDKSKNNWIKNNTVGPVIRNGLLVQFDANHNLFEGNIITGTTHDAFDMHGEGEYSNEFRNNTISGCLSTDPYTGATTYGSGFGVGEVPTATSFPPGDVGHHDFSGNNNWIHHNTITGCYSGIRINNTSYAYIENNTITNNRNGGILIGDLDSYIFPELASNPPPYGTNYIYVRDNTVKNNPVGIKMKNAKNAQILNNIVTNNTGAGLTLTAQTTGYTITSNDFRFNGSAINLGGNTSGIFMNNQQ